MARVYSGESTWLSPVIGPIERLVYRVAGVDRSSEQTWKQYTAAALAFNLVGFVVVYVLQRLQGSLPLNPQGFGGVAADSAFNTAVSFASNTNWQGYSGETTMSYLTQMLGLGVQNFLSAATGMAVLVALTRGFVRRESDRIGNFWVDLTRGTLHVLLPLSIVLAVALVAQGVVQSFAPNRTLALVEPLTIQVPLLDESGNAVVDRSGTVVTRTATISEQTLPLGPARARSPSSSSAPTAAASSTRIPRIRWRTRRRLPTSSRCSRSCSSRLRCA